MMAKHWYLYTTDSGKSYEMGAEFMIANRRVKLIGCDLYNMAGEYVGYWQRENMPMGVVHAVEKWLKGDPSAAAIMMRTYTKFKDGKEASNR